MTSGKSCIRCAKPLPADSVSELCKACTPDGKSAETPEGQKPAPAPLPTTITRKPHSPFDETASRPEDDGFLTEAAAPGRFNTDKADRNEDSSEIGNEPIVIDGYTLFGEIGRGGCGSVYDAVQIKTKRRVAIKILLGQSLSDRVRFDRETRALGKLNDPRVINVYEAGVCNAGPYFCMERMTGGSLAEHLKTNGTLEPKKAAELLESISRGMEAVHKAGLFHRDLKPGNILLDGEGKPKIADFGLAKAYEADPNETTAARISMAGVILGTPAFMAPEQADRRNHEFDARSDIYGLGAILYHCLTGKPPFSGKDLHRLLFRAINERPKDPSALRPGIPRELEAICLKCLEKQPNARYQTALALAEDLAAWQRGDETVARPATRLQRTGRWLKRQRRTMLIAGLVLAAAATINVAGMWLKGKQIDPESPDPDLLKKTSLLQSLDTLEPVIVVGETGRPAWYSKADGVVNFIESSYADAACTLETSRELRVVLLPEENVPDAIRFQADVRHEIANDGNSRIGVFFGENRRDLTNGESFIPFQRVALNDISNDFAPPGVFNSVQFQACVNKMSPGKLPWTDHSNLADMQVNLPKPFTPRPWRHLDIIITPERVDLTNTEKQNKFSPKSTFNNNELLNELNFALKKQNFVFTQNPGEIKAARGGLGLYLSHGSGSFKNVTIQKIDPKSNSK